MDVIYHDFVKTAEQMCRMCKEKSPRGHAKTEQVSSRFSPAPSTQMGVRAAWDKGSVNTNLPKYSRQLLRSVYRRLGGDSSAGIMTEPFRHRGEISQAVEQRILAYPIDQLDVLRIGTEVLKHHRVAAIR